MSLIHEALQKAEADRRAGELPALLSLGKTPRKPRPAPLLLLAASAAVVLAAAAVYSNRQLILATLGQPLPATAGENTASATQAAAPESTASIPALAQGSGDSTPNKPDSVRTEIAPAIDTMPPAMPAPLPPSMAAASVAETPATSPEVADNAPVEPIPVPPIAAAAVKPASADAADPPASALPTRASPADVATTPVSVAPAVDTPAGSETPATPPLAKGAVPYVFELPLETRQLLPALKVTMYVYNADPTKRFAIIDGKRVNEGGVVGQELDIVEIQRDAIMLKFRDTRFLLPRIGR